MYIAYKLILFEGSKPKLAVENLEFRKDPSGNLRFRDASGLQFVSDCQHSNLEVFQVNDHVLCIVKNNQFGKHEIYKALCDFHKNRIDNEIRRLNKIKDFL